MSFRFDHYVHQVCPEPDPRIDLLIALVRNLERIITMNQTELEAALVDVGAKLTEASTELLAKLAELQAAIVAAGNTTEGVNTALAGVTAMAQGLADIVPNP